MKHQSPLILLTLAASIWCAAAQPTAFTYQGRLADTSTGAAVPDGLYDFRFTLFPDATSQTPVLPDQASDLAVPVTNGLFTAKVDFGGAAYSVFQSPDRWLGVEVRTNAAFTFTAIEPRINLLSVPYALFANTASNLLGTLPASQLTGTLPADVLLNANGGGLTNLDASDLATGKVPDGRLAPNVVRTNQVWLLGGNGGTVAGAQFLGTTDNQPLELKVNGSRVARLEPTGDSDDSGTTPDGAPNVIAGSPLNAVTPGVVGATISGGGATNYGGLPGYANSIASHYSSIGGGIRNWIGTNSAFTLIGGGFNNWIDGNGNLLGAVIAGGSENSIRSDCPAGIISGGWYNSLSNAHHSTISGGDNNTIRATIDATIGGGAYHLIAASPEATIGGGRFHQIAFSQAATIAGGYGNQVGTNANFSTIGGGGYNTIRPNAWNATLAGGTQNTIGTNASGATLAGGRNNVVEAHAAHASIGGGAGNSIGRIGIEATIAGGGNNVISDGSYQAVIGGGAQNTIGYIAFGATVGGGLGNTILSNASYATIPGGYSNAAASFSFAAGKGAKAIHPGTFVWCDTAGGEFPSANSNQFLIRVANGVCIGGNNPQAHLGVVGPGTNPIVRLYQTEDKSASLNLGTQYRNWRIGQNRPPDDDTKTDGFFIYDQNANKTRLYITTSGRIGIGTNTPATTLDVNGTSLLRSNVTVGDAASVSCGSQTRQMLNLYNTDYGVGVQDNTTYFRSGKRFSWFADGTHSDTENAPGTGGKVLMTLKDDLLVVNGNMMTLSLAGLTVNGAFVSLSDRSAKEEFKPVDSQAVLDKVLALPLSEWHYKSDPGHSRHLGPMAQDFHAAFGLGADDKHIATVDADGVALAAIQGLNQKLTEREAALRRELDQKASEITDLKARLAKLEQFINAKQ